jgi:hypothetical protein
VQKRAEPIAAAAKTRRTRMGEDAGKHRLGSVPSAPSRCLSTALRFLAAEGLMS